LKRLLKKSSSKVKLMHGTSSSYIDSILKEGLIPVAFTGNLMFNYNDYGRKGEPKHPECIYLTNDLENATRYANNSVKHNGGFPLILEVEVDSDALSWDDDAFYKNYGDFDFGEKDGDRWVRKPKKELWQQSLDINMQCTHFGKIESNKFTKIYIEGKWVSIDDFIVILEKYKNTNIEVNIIEENNNTKTKKVKINSDKIIFDIVKINRIMYFYNLNILKEIDKHEKFAINIKFMEKLKEFIGEFGCKIVYTPDFKKLNFIAKSSCFNYVFGAFEIVSNDDIEDKIKNTIESSIKDEEKLINIINLKANEEEFNYLYDYSVDFSGDIVEYCRNTLNYSNEQIIEVLEKIKNNYSDSYEQLSAEIEYLKIK